ncbi:MAG: OmpA family protein [Lysobacterales bacterium]
MKGIVFFWILLLAGWMAGAEYVWLCQVKNHCETATEATAATSAQAIDSESPDGREPREDILANADPGARPSASSQNDLTPIEPATNTAAADAATTPTADFATTAAQPAKALVNQNPEPQALASSVTIRVGGQTLYASDPFGFETNQWQLGKTSNGPGIATELAQILRQHQALEITVSGQYLETESTPQGHSNLGVARAQSFSDALVDAGIARDRISRNSVLLTDTGLQPGVAMDTLDFSALLESHAMYFDTASAAPRPTPQLDKYIREVTQFLRTHRGASVRITGHTDNTGVIEGNDALGLRRARQAAEQLATMGLPATRVRIGSEGQNQPVADNSSPAGRAANRRVEIQLDMGRR